MTDTTAPTIRPRADEIAVGDVLVCFEAPRATVTHVEAFSTETIRIEADGRLFGYYPRAARLTAVAR